MATANQRFHDALLRRQHHLQYFGNGLTSDVNKVLDRTEASLSSLLRDRVATIVDKGYDAGPSTTSRLRVLQSSVADIRSKGFQDATRVWSDQLQAVVKAESAYVDAALTEISPVVLDTVLPPTRLLGALVDDDVILGSVLDEWVASMADGDVTRIMNAVQTGLVKGDDMATIQRAVLGTRTMVGGDGVTELTRRDAQNFTRTAVNSFTNQARESYFQENDDIFDEEQYVATLDSKTTPLCRSLDGNRYKVGEGPIPGRDTHWNCRSVRVAVIDGEVIGDRPAAAWTEDDLDGLSRADRRAKIRELTGQVPASTTYQDWLMDQTSDFQDTVLGEARAERFRNGQVTLKGLVNTNTGRQWSLAKLKEMEPQTWGQ